MNPTTHPHPGTTSPNRFTLHDPRFTRNTPIRPGNPAPTVQIRNPQSEIRNSPRIPEQPHPGPHLVYRERIREEAQMTTKRIGFPPFHPPATPAPPRPGRPIPCHGGARTPPNPYAPNENPQIPTPAVCANPQYPPSPHPTAPNKPNRRSRPERSAAKSNGSTCPPALSSFAPNKPNLPDPHFTISLLPAMFYRENRPADPGHKQTQTNPISRPAPPNACPRQPTTTCPCRRSIQMEPPTDIPRNAARQAAPTACLQNTQQWAGADLNRRHTDCQSIRPFCKCLRRND